MNDTPENVEDFVSNLDSGPERVLARLLVHAVEEEWCSAADFLERFPPSEIMARLEDAPDLRARLLIEGAGVHEKIAHKKSASSAAEDLRIALDEGICEPETILGLLPADDRVRFFDQPGLWLWISGDDSWLEEDDERTRARLLFTLETALQEECLTSADVADGVSFETISRQLPREELERVFVLALEAGRKGDAFGDEAFFDAIPLETLVRYLPAGDLWSDVIVAKVAVPAGFTDEPAPLLEPKKSAPPPVPQASAKPASTSRRRKKGKKPDAVVGSPPPPPTAARPALGAPPGEPIAPVPTSDEIDELVGQGRSPQEEEARNQAVGKLAAIDRLPPKHAELATSILLSLESMYAELLELTSDDEREACIMDSFPNEAQLTIALLSLIELLDPSIDINDPVIRDADSSSLIKVVLFEERHRAEQAQPSRSPMSAVPPPPPQRRSSGNPPPLPKKSMPPPLPPPARLPRAR